MNEPGEGPRLPEASSTPTASQEIHLGAEMGVTGLNTEPPSANQPQTLIETRAKDITMQRRGRRIFNFLRK